MFTSFLEVYILKRKVYILKNGDFMSNLETKIQNEIILAINERSHRLRRANSGTAYSRSMHAIKLMPKGFTDTFGFHKDTGQIIFIEVKTPTGKLRKEQVAFKNYAKSQNVIYGVATNVKEAIEIVEGTI